MRMLSAGALCAVPLAMVLAGKAEALTTTSAAVACSPTVRLQAKIDAVPAGTVATFNVSGTCNENIVVPQGKTIIIAGATATARITAADILQPAVIARGDVTLRKMILGNATGAAEALVETDKGGSLTIISSDLSAPFVGSVVGGWLGQTRVTNSRVVGGTDDAVEAWGVATVVVEGDPMFPTGPTGAFETYLKSTGSGIGCAQGANLRVQAKTYASASGIVTIEKSATGIWGSTCDFNIRNKTSLRGNLRIRNNGQGIRLGLARGEIDNVTITGNANDGIALNTGDLNLSRSTLSGNKYGLTASQSRVSIDATTFSNASADLQAFTMSEVNLYNWNGASSFPKALTWTGSFNCGRFSHIVIDPNALSASLGTKYDFLDCLTVGW